jgi:hemoglobin
MRIRFHKSLIVLPICLLWICGCGGGPPEGPAINQPMRPPGQVTLYDRLGGQPAIYAITDNLIDRALRDPRVQFQRAGHEHTWAPTPDSVAQLKMYWAQFIGMLADGPQLYEGHNILDTHRGMDISEGEWLAFMEDLKQTLDQLRIPADQQQELITRVAATHDDVVNK